MEDKLQFDFKTNQKILQKISKIDQFKGEWESLQKFENQYLKNLKQIATLQSIGSSNRIEGNTLTDAEIASLLKNTKTQKLVSRDEQEVMGYYETLELITENFEHIPLSHTNIHQLHNNLLRYSTKDERHKGTYKQIANQVVATMPDESSNVIFRTTETFLVEKEMENAINWTNEHEKNGEIHPLIYVATFVYEFLSIHPYQDGNGRLSRLLTTLLMLRADYGFVMYVSLENIIEQHKKEYYQALIEGQKNRNTAQEKIHIWLLFFLDCVDILTQKLSAKIKESQFFGVYLSERQQNIFDFIQKNQPTKRKDLNAIFENLSENTLKKEIQFLVKQGKIKKIGTFKNAFYVENLPSGF